MMEPQTRPTRFRRLVRRKWLWAVASLPLIVLAVSGWLTAPLEPPSVGTTSTKPTLVKPPEVKLADWPTVPIEGPAATRLLLDSLLSARDRLAASGGYTALFRKVERVNGTLGAERVMEMKCRHDPFAIYLKFRTPEPGKEVVFSTGHYDDEVIAHGVGLSRRLVPRLKLSPEAARAISGDRHPITEAGLWNLTERLIKYRRLDLDDREARTVLDRTLGDDGREYLRSSHTHPTHKSNRPFQVVEVLYDPLTRIPVAIWNYDWLSPGGTGEPRLAESYRYDDLKLDVRLSDLDFDPANPAYDFTRF
jgi:hypothetical protein